jgi:hypothetical protein
MNFESYWRSCSFRNSFRIKLKVRIEIHNHFQAKFLRLSKLSYTCILRWEIILIIKLLKLEFVKYKIFVIILSRLNTFMTFMTCFGMQFDMGTTNFLIFSRSLIFIKQLLYKNLIRNSDLCDWKKLLKNLSWKLIVLIQLLCSPLNRITLGPHQKWYQKPNNSIYQRFVFSLGL